MEPPSTFFFAMRIIATTFGVLGGGFLGNLIGPWVAKSRRSQSGILVVGSVIGGALMWLVFTHTGGGGFGLGGGPGKGPGNGTVNHQGTDKDKDGKVERSKDKDSPSKTAETSLTVTVLGGERVKEQRFYVLGKAPPRTRAELEAAIVEAKRANPTLRVLEIQLYMDSVAKDSEAVTELEQWAKVNGLTPKVTLVPKMLP